MLRGAVAELEQAGVASPTPDAEQLLAHVLGLSRGELLTASFLGDQITVEQTKFFAQLVARRAAREPLQHLTGSVSFLGMELTVGPGVFVPRPETEYLIELVRLNSSLSPTMADTRLLDIGTGSGAIACALQQLFPSASVTAIELDPRAAEWAERNFAKNAARVRLERGDFAQILPTHRAEFDLIVSNPPYIPADAVPQDPEVRLHDPELALYSGDDGLDAIRGIASLAPHAIRPGGGLWLEHADSQSKAIVELLLAEGWSAVRAWRDLTGRKRYVSAQWN